MLSELPIELKHVEEFQEMLDSCDRNYNGTRPSVEPIEYETHYDPDMVSILTPSHFPHPHFSHISL